MRGFARRGNWVRMSSTTPLTLSTSNRQINLILELDQAIECIEAGLERLGKTALRADSPTLFLLANGVERYLKVAVHVLHHHQKGEFASKKTMKGYGHEILSLQGHVFTLESPRTTEKCREDRSFVEEDPLSKALLETLHAFAINERYFLLDGVSGEPVDPDKSPRARWEEVIGLIPDEDDNDSVAAKLTERCQRYLRCIAQGVLLSTDGASRSLASRMNDYLLIKDEALNTPFRR